MEAKEEDVKFRANKYSERPLGMVAQMREKDYKELGPIPLFEPKFKSWYFLRGSIIEFMATFLFLYITILTIMGIKWAPSVCTYVGIGYCAFSGMIFSLIYFTIGILGIGHINPTLTFGLFLTRKLSLSLLYMICQFLGTICGVRIIKGF
eukprot:Gb_30042 [translate_table: standard]